MQCHITWHLNPDFRVQTPGNVAPHGAEPRCRYITPIAVAAPATTFQPVAQGSDSEHAAQEKAQRRAARAFVASYHQEELRRLLDKVRDGFARLDAGEINEFDLDELIHRYKKAATRLWAFCGSSGSQWQRAAAAIQYRNDQGEPPRDWWAEAESREQ